MTYIVVFLIFSDRGVIANFAFTSSVLRLIYYE